LRTVLYADVLNTLTIDEISHWAIGAPLATGRDAVSVVLALARRAVERVNGYVAARGRAQVVVPLRERAAASRAPVAAARVTPGSRAPPFVRRVAITGALALDNADAAGDIT
jgi:hypothetical protein